MENINKQTNTHTHTRADIKKKTQWLRTDRNAMVNSMGHFSLFQTTGAWQMTGK